MLYLKGSQYSAYKAYEQFEKSLDRNQPLQVTILSNLDIYVTNSKILS